MKVSYKIIIPILLLLSIPLSVACSKVGDTTDTPLVTTPDESSTESESETAKNPTDEKDYSIEYRDGKYFIVFEHPEYYFDESIPMEDVWREDWRDLRNAVLNGELSILEKAIIIDNFLNDTKNIEIPDFYNFYGPTVPETLTVCDDLTWQGDFYMFIVENDDVFCQFLVYTERAYQEAFDRKHTNIELGKNKTLQSYTIQDGDKTILVDKIYSSSKLDCINLFGVQDGRCFIVEIHDVPEAPTDEWLLSFGLERYVEEAVE